jgi:hypothetical protein
MGIVEMKLFMFTLGLLIKALLNGKADTEKLKQQIVEAKTKEEVKAALIGGITETITAGVDTDLDEETEQVITDLVISGSPESVDEVIARPNILSAILDGIGKLISGFSGGNK